MNTHNVAQVSFDRVWRLQAEKGRCDSSGGAEHTRVLKEWRALRENDAHMLALFIAWRANVAVGQDEHDSLP